MLTIEHYQWLVWLDVAALFNEDTVSDPSCVFVFADSSAEAETALEHALDLIMRYGEEHVDSADEDNRKPFSLDQNGKQN